MGFSTSMLVHPRVYQSSFPPQRSTRNSSQEQRRQKRELREAAEADEEALVMPSLFGILAFQSHGVFRHQTAGSTLHFYNMELRQQKTGDLKNT